MNPGTTTTTELDAATVLSAARRFRRDANTAETGVLEMAIEWARLHQVTDLDDAATWCSSRGEDTGIPIAGEGCPLVSEFAVAELATALGLTAGSGRNLIAQALELAYRLPKPWARVQTGSLAPWRARRIAEETLNASLSAEAAAWVDAQVAPFAHKTGLAQTQRLVETAITRHMPDYARERRERAAEQRYFTIDHDQVSFAGTSRVHGELDLADALDLEDAVAAGAAQLAALGSEDTLDVRRAAAVGLEDAGGRLLTAGQIAEWCGRPDTSRVTIKPVIDLREPHAVDAYQVPDRIAERIRLRDKTCVHPYCHRPARRCDLDHIDPWVDPDDGGPPAQTSTQNLAPLCRLHHRMKTHGGWTYTMVEPGVYLWRSPHGYTWLRDSSGTTDLTPDPVDPPER